MIKLITEHRIFFSNANNIVGRQNLSEFLCKILRDTFVKYKHYLHFPFPGFVDVDDALFVV
jgi:hypothetical protein